MEITKTAHDSGLGIYGASYAPQTPAELKTAISVAQDMLVWFNEKNGSFKGKCSKAYALAHCQVAPVKEPWAFFVVAENMVKPKRLAKNSKETLENYYFESGIILNVEILETPKTIKKKIPIREVVRDKHDATNKRVEVRLETKTVPNLISVPEACMSFPHRRAKHKQRYYKIKVQYQYVDAKGAVKKFKGWVSGLKAHILQHEAEHFAGKNMFFSK